MINEKLSPHRLYYVYNNVNHWFELHNGSQREKIVNKILVIVGIFLSANSFAYITSADAHKVCDPTGVQYDHTNKQFCCGTKGGCPGALQRVIKDKNTNSNPELKQELPSNQ